MVEFILSQFEICKKCNKGAKKQHGKGWKIPCIRCAACKQISHLKCLNLTNKEVKLISKYFCHECEKKGIHKSMFQERRIGLEQPNEGFSITKEFLDAFQENCHVGDDNVMVVNEEELNLEFVEEKRFVRPVLITDKGKIGLQVPDNPILGLETLLKEFGSLQKVYVINVKTQSEEGIFLGEYCAYVETSAKAEAADPFCLLCLEVSKKCLGKKIEVPTFMKEIDIKNGLRNAEDLQKVDKFVLHFMPNSFVNFSLDMSGSSIWHHVIQGEETLYFLDSSEEVLKNYEQWHAGDLNGLTDFLKSRNCQKVQIKKGETIFVPGGMLRATYTEEETVVLGGNVLTLHGACNQFESYNLEVKMMAMDKYRYPSFKKINWMAAQNILRKVHEGVQLSQSDGKFVEASMNHLKQWKKSLSPKYSDNIWKEVVIGICWLENELRTKSSGKDVQIELIQNKIVLNRFKLKLPAGCVRLDK